MLRSARDFEAFRSGSRSKAHPLLIVRWRANELGHPRFGISTGRKLGGAVVRNRTRRRLREALRASERRPSGGVDVLVVARPDAAAAAFSELRSVVDRLLGRIERDEGSERGR
jgi:ribonuclease P protein component